jgi:hypothetical protein
MPGWASVLSLDVRGTQQSVIQPPRPAGRVQGEPVGTRRGLARARELRIRVPVQPADKLPTVLMAEVERDIPRVKLEHVPGVPAEVVTGRGVRIRWNSQDSDPSWTLVTRRDPNRLSMRLAGFEPATLRSGGARSIP